MKATTWMICCGEYHFIDYPQAILGSKILYKGKEVPVLEDDGFDDKIAIYSRDYDKQIINRWRPCFAIINGEANIPEGTEEIDRYAFRDCSDLTSIVIPNTVTIIYDRAFSGCPNLSSIVVSEGNKIYDSRDNCNAIIKTESNTLIAGCKNTVIPDSVTEIGRSAFKGCTGLKSVEIQAKLKSIDGMFENCISLETVTFPASISKIDEAAFKGCTALKTINVPAKKADYYKKRLPWNLHRLIVELPAEKKAKKK